MIRKELTFLFILVSNFHFGQNLIWAKSIGGVDEDVCNSMTIDQSGNVYSTGSFRGTVDFDPGIGTYNLTSAGNSADVFILKLDAMGNFVWARRMGGIHNEEATSITFDNLGNIYTTGYFQNIVDFDPGPNTFTLSASLGEIFISKLDAQGDFLWARSMGGSSLDKANCITTDSVGNVFTSGYFSSTSDFDPGTGVYNLTSAGGFDIFISKLNASGNFIWAKNIGGTADDVGNSLTLDQDGNIYVTGFYQSMCDFDPGTGIFNLSNAGSSDIFITKLSSSGNLVWAKGIGDYGLDISYSVKLDASGNSYITGHFREQVDFDPGPSIYKLNAAGTADMFVLKLDVSGNFLWVKQFGDISGQTIGRCINIDGSGNIYIAGSFSGHTDFNPALLDTFELSSISVDDIFLLGLDPVGNFRYAEAIGGSGNDAATSLGIGLIGEVYLAGYFHSSVDFDASQNVNTLTANGNYIWSDIFILKQGPITTDIKSVSFDKKIDVFPNPCSVRLNIRQGMDIINCRFVLFNTLGQKINEWELRPGITELNIRDISSGLYTYLISGGSQVQTGKLVIE